MSVSVDLSRKQLNALHKGKTIILKPNQMDTGNHALLLNDAELRRYRNAVRNNKGMKITVNNLDGSGFKDVMKGLKKGVSKAMKVAKPIVKDVGRELLKANRSTIDKAMKKQREITERGAEDLLMNMGVPKELAQDLVTDTSMVLSKRASKQLDKLEGKVDAVLQDPEMGMVKGRDYAYLNPYNVNPDGLNVPTAVATAIEEMKGSGVRRVVYLKGKGVPKFLKKVGNVLGKVVKSKPVKKILTDLAKQGVASLATSVTGNPAVGQMVGTVTGNLVEQGVNEATDVTGDALGAGVLTRPKTEMRGVSKMGGALYVPRGGALFVPQSQGRKTGRGLVGPQQGGIYYI